jgi:LacI family transcriptional regulator
MVRSSLTSKDLAALAGVSQATVSRVIRGSPNVSKVTREKVLRVLSETDYAPNASAQNLRNRASGVIGVVVGRVTNPFYPELLDALSRAIAGQDRQMSLWVSDDEGSELGALEAIRQQSIDGTIYTTVTAGSKSLKLALKQGSPVVLVNRTLDDLDCDKVSSDNRQGGARVAEHLVSLGHMNLALLNGPSEVSTGNERAEGFRDALRERGIELAEGTYFSGDFSHAFGYAAMRKLLAHKDPPTGVFCVNDVIAFGAIDAARNAGVNDPRRLSIVGYDDVEMASWDIFSLTTVRQPTTEMAQIGVETLLERIENPEMPYSHRRIRSELIVRGSTGPRMPPQ